MGVGASAGGLEAFSRLIGDLPANTGLAYVLVQHLDPRHDSVLAELLGRTTAVPVAQATDGMKIEADHAYVIPPNATMTVADGHLRLVQRAPTGGPHLSIDAFLDGRHRIFGRRATASRLADLEVTVPAFDASKRGPGRVALVPGASPSELETEADRLALGHYAPPGVVVNDRLEVLQFRGRTGDGARAICSRSSTTS